MRKISYISLFIFIPLIGVCQSLDKQGKKNLKHAYYFLEMGDYVTAYFKFQDLKEHYDHYFEIDFGIGRCKLNQKGQEKHALSYLEPIHETKNFENFYYYLGLAYHWNGKFEEAINCFHTILVDKKRTMDDAPVLEALNRSYNSQELITAKRKVEIINLGSTINSKNQESVPVLLPNNKGMFFTSRREDNVSRKKDYLDVNFQDIYFSKLDNYQWSTPRNLTEINSDLHDASASITADGSQFVYFKTNKVKVTGGDLYIADCDSNGNITNSRKLGNEINTEYIESSACFSSDGNTLFFSSNRPNGYGGFDLYKCNKLPNGEWGRVINLGPNINTKYNEDAPFLHYDGSTLYFSSNGHLGMGGYDIFYTKMNKAGIWRKPENIGYPINTINHDMYITVLPDERTAYFSSDREGGFGSDDIYKVAILDHESYKKVVKGTVTDETTGKALKTKITVINEEDHNLNGIYRSNPNNGNFIMVIRPMEYYQFIIEAEGFQTKILNFSFEDLEEIKKLKIDLKPTIE